MKKFTVEYSKSKNSHIMTIMVYEKNCGFYKREGEIISKSYRGMWEKAKPVIDAILGGGKRD